MTNIRIIDKNQKLLPNKLGTHSGSVVNWSRSRSWFKPDALTIGNGATIYYWSDRHGGTLIDVITRKNGRRFIVVQVDHAKRTDRNGFSESQTYEFTPNPEGRKHYAEVIDIETEEGERGFILEPREFNPKTNRFSKDGNRITLGHRSEYWDPSF
tara:strand:- start:401 stop:865 length:465 start_codon:yes stop_codon:yes gene_type:complete